MTENAFPNSGSMGTGPAQTAPAQAPGTAPPVFTAQLEGAASNAGSEFAAHSASETPQAWIAAADVDRVPALVHSILTLLRLYGKTSSSALLMAHIHGAATPQACLRAAKHAGLNARIVERDSVADISPLTLPCILLLKNNRSCVLKALREQDPPKPQKLESQAAEESPESEAMQGVLEGEVRLVADIILPEEGEGVKSVPLESLQAEYMGYCLFAVPEASLDARASSIQLLHHKRWFWDVLLHYMPIYKHVIVASVVINIVAIASSLFAMNVYDRVIPNNALETLWVLALGIFLAYAFDFVLRNVRGYFVDLAGRNADVVLSSTLVRKVLSMRLDAKPESTGALVNNLREFESLREFFSSGSLLAFVDLPFLVIFLFLIAYIAGPLVFLPLGAIPLMIGLGLFFQSAAKRTAEQGYKQNMQKNALLVEMVSGLETLKTTMAESRLQYIWEQIVDISAESSSHNKQYSTLTVTLSTAITQLVSVGMIVWGVYRIAEGQLTMGGLIGCNILVGRAMAPLMQISGMLTRLQQSRMALKALDMLMALPSEEQQGNGMDFGPLEPSFRFENVVFQYPGAKSAALNDISLNIEAGEKVAIIGRMGSGKSTIGKLMMGLFQPSSGAVKFGGVDIRQLDTTTLRSRIGYLPQEVILFYGTVRENIALSNPAMDDRHILQASYLADTTPFIRNHPAGFGAQVGERGSNLSGGQRQSVALARALLNDPDVLILDEPTSNMDSQTELTIKARMAQVMEHKTVVLITHRPSLLDLVDRLIVMEEGRIVADGPRLEVLKELAAKKMA